MKDRLFSRRNFLKIAGAATATPMLASLIPNTPAYADSLKSSETEGIKSGEYFYPSQTILLLVPVSRDWTYNDVGETPRTPVKITISDPVMLQARQVHEVLVNGFPLKVGEVPLCGGGLPKSADQYLGLVILEAEGKAFYQPAPASGEIISGFTGAFREGVNPAKIWNMLNAAKNILTFQEGHDGFSDGDYSFLQIQNFLRDGNFKTGTGWNNTPILADGADAVATILSKALYPLTLSGKVQVTERTPHIDGFTYFDGPTTPEITADATDADIAAPAGKQKTDFTWSFAGLGKAYLWVEASVIPNDANWCPDAGWLDTPADAGIILSVSIRKSPPGLEQSQRIQDLMNNYSAYHAQGPSCPAAGALGQKVNQESVSWESTGNLIEVVHPELVTNDFQSEINGSDKGRALTNLTESLGSFDGKSLTEVNKFYFALIYYLQGLTADYANKYPYTLEDYKAGKKRPVPGLGNYFTTKMQDDGIFEPLRQMSEPVVAGKPLTKMEYALGDLRDYSYISPGEPLQCLGWAELLGSLDAFPLAPSFIGDVPTGSASGLLSDGTRKTLRTADSCSDGQFNYNRVESTHDVEVGDLGIRYGGKNNHIFTVIGKKSVNGETKLLLTDANRKNDGEIRVFEVDNNNFPVIFGDAASAYPPIVIRNPSVQTYIGRNENPLLSLFGH